MANAYFEIHGCDEYYYISYQEDVGYHDLLRNVPRKLAYMSTRIWIERNGKVKFIKNRYVPQITEVDLKEFMWVKLKSQEFNQKEK